MDSKDSLRKILIIDDDGDCRKLLMNWLASQFQDIEVVEYDPQSQGVPGKDFNWSAYDALLLDYDLQLDDVTGLDILQDNYDNLFFPATIMLTGAGNEEIAVRAIRSGVTDYLSKEQLKKETIKAAIDNAFDQQSAKHEHLYTLDDALRVAQTEAKRIIEAYKTKYEQERESEINRLKAETQQVEEELIKNQTLLAELEKNQKNTEIEKCELLIKARDQSEQQSSATEKDDIKKKLDTTQNELLLANDNIKSVMQSINNAKAAIEKTKWKQDQGATEQQEVENDLAIVLDDMKQTADTRDEMRERLDMYLKRGTNKINTEEENQNLADEITSKLKTQDE